MIKAIPTEYKGRQYRSRLEARWAAFFLEIGWHAEYEPFDLNGWIPDFLLIGKKDEVLVEVKPFNHFEEFDTGKIIRAMGDEPREVLLLGVSIFPERESEMPFMGWLGEVVPDGGFYFGKALFNTLGGIGFCHDDCTYRNRITGEHEGYTYPPDRDDWEDIMRAWNHAANAVQWAAKGA